jgi:hypothetical protein
MIWFGKRSTRPRARSVRVPRDSPTSTRKRQTIAVKSSSDKKSQVSGQGSGRASGTRTRNLWIKSPQLCQLS